MYDSERGEYLKQNFFTISSNTGRNIKSHIFLLENHNKMSFLFYATFQHFLGVPFAHLLIIKQLQKYFLLYLIILFFPSHVPASKLFLQYVVFFSLQYFPVTFNCCVYKWTWKFFQNTSISPKSELSNKLFLIRTLDKYLTSAPWQPLLVIVLYNDCKILIDLSWQPRIRYRSGGQF